MSQLTSECSECEIGQNKKTSKNIDASDSEKFLDLLINSCYQNHMFYEFVFSCSSGISELFHLASLALHRISPLVPHHGGDRTLVRRRSWRYSTSMSVIYLAVYIYIIVYMYMCVYVYVRMYTCVCIPVYICMYINIYNYIYIYPRGPRYPQGVGWGGAC